MKKLLLFLTIFTISFVVSQNAVFAGGDKVQGDLGQGVVSQEGPCPFGGDTPAGPNQ